MNKINKYKIVSSVDSTTQRVSAIIAEKVATLIVQDWEPIGGISFIACSNSDGTVFYEAFQAMIMRSEN